MSPPSEIVDTKSWHKRFAMDCNNRAWELSALPRTPTQDREMLDAAHASAWHWAQVGNELNRMRATMLLAEVHAVLGHGSVALPLAQEMRAFFVGRDTPDWELAFTHAIYAHAAHAACQLAEYRSAYQQAVVALEAITDKEDRSVVLKTFSQIPRER